MSTFPLDDDKPVPVSGSPARHMTVYNAGPSVVYYKAAGDVDSGDTELAVGESVTIEEGTRWFISASASRLFTHYTPDNNTDLATQAELDAIDQNEALAANGKGYTSHGEEAGAERPSGFASIEWHGSVEPENMTENDTWIETV